MSKEIKTMLDSKGEVTKDSSKATMIIVNKWDDNGKLIEESFYTCEKK